ncbi:MAG TPA: adenylate/guanylate cyclase domain-containing protein [Solimonas sp.]|nr:adenylate/guanylate cyclase domain-containing protein [Solimonas sp.]
MASCPTCSSSNPDGARFCNQCGARLDGAPEERQARDYTPRHLADRILRSRSAMQGERKRVTVLFCDIKGSTRLAQEAGAEAWHGILDRFFSILSGAVHRYEGTVNQYTGDGVMALFGAPIAHEDHAQRACFAALEMQREVRRFADELRLQRGLNLSMRVGLNTGEVIVGRIGDDLRMDYTAQGATVNLAARMEHICEPGRVYLTRNTAALVEGYFHLRDLGPMSVAGVDQPVEVYELEGEGQIKTRLDRSLARGGSQFVGREPELNQLLGALQRVRAGVGQVVAVIGNAGIGKSRLCYEFARACEQAGLRVHRATGVPYANALPLHPVQTLTRSRLGVPERAVRDDVRRLVAGTFLLHDPANAAILPAVFDFLGIGEGTGLAPDQATAERARMFELLARYIPSSDDSHQVLLVEDLHFLDTASEEFLAALCAQVRSQRTLLLVNYRPDYVSEWLVPHLDEQISVSALTAEQLEQLACNLLGPHASLKGVAQTIRERASGNPFFVEEAVQALADSGHLAGERGAYHLDKPIEEWPVPDTVHALLAARIDRLPEEHKSLLQTAAVIGQQFQPRLLSALAGVDDDPCDEQLAALEDAGFVHQRSTERESEYAFCHPLMQEVAYSTQLESRRAQSHARLAGQLEAAHPLSAPPDETSVRIAHHLQQAGEWARAAAWNLQAARWAASRDVRVTLAQFRAAMANLERAPLSPEVTRMRIAARAGLIRMAQFSSLSADEVEGLYIEARRLADASGDIASTAELLLSYGNELLHRGNADAGADYTAEAVHLMVKHGQREQVGRFRLAILLTHNAAGRPREGVELVDAGGSDWRTRPIDEDNFMSRGFYGLMLAWLGRLDEAQDNLRGAVAFATREDRAASWMHANLVELAWFTGDLRSVLAEARIALESAQRFGSDFFIAFAMRALGRAYSMLGDYQQAIPYLEQARPLVAPGAAGHQFEATMLAALADAYNGAGRHAEAYEMALASVASGQQSKSRVWEALGWLSLLGLPVDGPWAARVPEAFARVTTLMEESGAVGFEPWLFLAQSRWAATAAERAQWRAKARQRFAELGAPARAAALA